MARRPARRVYMPSGEGRPALGALRTWPLEPGRGAADRARSPCDVLAVPGPLAGARRVPRRGRAALGRCAVCRECRAHRSRGLGRPCASIARCAARRTLPPETRVFPGHGPETTIGARARDEPVPRGAADERAHRAPARHARLAAAARRAAPARRRRRAVAAFERAGFGQIVTPTFEDTALFARTSGETSDVVSQGDVHVPRPRRPRADAAPRGHGARSCAPTSSTGWRASRSP